jgi:hypothetical protein
MTNSCEGEMFQSILPFFRNKDIFRPTVGNASLHVISSVNGARVVKFALSENVVVKSTVFPYYNIYKYACTYDEKI